MHILFYDQIQYNYILYDHDKSTYCSLYIILVYSKIKIVVTYKMKVKIKIRLFALSLCILLTVVAEGGQDSDSDLSKMDLEALQQLQELQLTQQLQSSQGLLPSQSDLLSQAIPREGEGTSSDGQNATGTVQRSERGVPHKIAPTDEQGANETIDDNTNSVVDEPAYSGALDAAFPMTPEQIMQLREIYNSMQQAESVNQPIPPRPIITSQNVSLATGETPPVIRLSQGFVSSLVFLDASGQPWPIAAYDLGNPEGFNIQWDQSSNTLMVQALQMYTYGNLAVRLEDLTTPVMLTLTPGQQAIDYRIDLRIQGYGPNASVSPAGQGMPDTIDPMLLSVLDGIPPPNSRELSVTGGEAQVWEGSDSLFLRTRLTILSPGWSATVSSADGMKVYEIQKTPVILISQRGEIGQLRIKGL